VRRSLLALALIVILPRLTAAQETIEYYATDALGSVRIAFASNGTVVGRQDYAPFGRPLFLVPTMPKEGFGAQEKDDESDQSYFHARMFQDRTGRFSRPDPIGAGLFAPQRWNRYAYALNNPMTFSDTNGLNPIPFFFPPCVFTFCESTGVTAPDPGLPGIGAGGGPGDGMIAVPSNPGEGGGGGGSTAPVVPELTVTLGLPVGLIPPGPNPPPGRPDTPNPKKPLLWPPSCQGFSVTGNFGTLMAQSSEPGNVSWGGQMRPQFRLGAFVATENFIRRNGSRGRTVLIRPYLPHASHGDPDSPNPDLSYLKSGTELNVLVEFYQPPMATATGRIRCTVP
jgi:RHS repeat-associated protein